jgi:hypothetical protein
MADERITKGIRVASPGQSTTQTQSTGIDIRRKQFKFSRDILETVAFPATANGSSNEVTVIIPHGATYVPAYEMMFQGYNGRWGILPGDQGGIKLPSAAHDEWPYQGTDNINTSNYEAEIAIYNYDTSSGTPISGGSDIPAHNLQVRLTIFYDELEDV